MSAALSVFGGSVLSYTLNIPVNDLDSLVKSEADGQRLKALSTLDALAKFIVSKRQKNSPLNSDDIGAFLVEANGFNILSNFRRHFSEWKPLPTGDHIVDCLTQYADTFYLSALLSENFPFPFFTPQQFFLDRRLNKDFLKIALLDPAIGGVFLNSSANSEMPTIGYQTSTGRGGVLQLHFLPEQILRTAFILARIREYPTLDGYCKCISEVVEIVRSLCMNESARVPVALLFDWVSIPQNRKFKTILGEIWSPSAEASRVFSPNAQPTNMNNIKGGFAFLAEIEYKVKFFNTAPADDEWLLPLTGSDEIEALAHKVPLAIAISVNEVNPAAAVHLSTCTLSAISAEERIVRLNFGTASGFENISDENFERIAETINNISELNLTPVKIGVRRFISALSHRPNVVDSFIDCMVSFENLFGGGRSEISSSLASAVSLLLSKPGAERESLYSEVKKLYDLRSSIVHGSKVKDREISQKRNRALKLLSDCYRVLCINRTDLLPLKADERAKRIILER